MQNVKTVFRVGIKAVASAWWLHATYAAPTLAYTFAAGVVAWWLVTDLVQEFA